MPRGPTTARGIALGEDYTRWEIWWELNKGPWLLRRDDTPPPVATNSDEFFLGATRATDASDRLRPTEYDVLHDVLPALHRAIDAAEHRSIVNACLLAIAKVGRPHADFDWYEAIAKRLCDGDREVCETAALALGVTASTDPRFLAMLTDLAADAAAARKACGQDHVDDRMRAYALYGLGLLARGSTDSKLQGAILAAAQRALLESPRPDRNVEVAAISAIGQLHVDAGSHAGQRILDDACRFLISVYQRPYGPGDQLVLAHCPPALARLVGQNGPRAGECRRLFLAELAGQLGDGRTNVHLAQSSALALGPTGLPWNDDDPESGACVDALVRTWHDHKDAQTRGFAVIALGQIGGSRMRSLLAAQFDKAGKVMERPWVAMAIGEYAARNRRAARAQGADAGAGSDAELGRLLSQALTDVKTPSTQAAIAVAIGQCGRADAAPRLLEIVQRDSSDDDLTGQVAIGLALLGERHALEPLREQLRGAVRRPMLFRQLALALGKLGDRSVAGELTAMLGDDLNTARLNAISAALGIIRDRRSIQPLIDRLFDRSLPALARAFAAEALGSLAEKSDEPWSDRYRVGVNYRAAVETLSDQGMGVLSLQ